MLYFISFPPFSIAAIIGFDRNSITVNEGLMKNISLRLSTHLQSQSLGTVNISQSPMNSGLFLYNDTLKISSATSLRDLVSIGCIILNWQWLQCARLTKLCKNRCTVRIVIITYYLRLEIIGTNL